MIATFFIALKRSKFKSFLLFLLHMTPTVDITDPQAAVYTGHFRYEPIGTDDPTHLSPQYTDDPTRLISSLMLLN